MAQSGRALAAASAATDPSLLIFIHLYSSLFIFIRFLFLSFLQILFLVTTHNQISQVSVAAAQAIIDAHHGLKV